tara:strand:- start:505 stop:1473 length:969 start_codon:yes stop_codon:yes gene_type:complete
MNNITPMFANNSALQAIRDGGYGSAGFDIGVATLTYNMPYPNDNIDIPSSKSVIYRTDTGAELGIHGHGYKPVAPKHMIDVTRNIIERSDLSINGMQEIIRTSHDGARTFVQYRLPEHTYTTSDGDNASLSLLAISSFDGTWPFMISAAAIQSACTNLQVFVGGEVSVYRAKHTRSLDIEQGGRVITKSLQMFHNERDLWQQWHDTDVTANQAFKFFAEALKCKGALNLIRDTDFMLDPVAVMYSMPRRNLNLEYIWKQYISVYSKRLGHNYWAVYNALTDWSTHASASRSSSSDNIASIQNDRQQVVRDAVKSNYVMKAAA